MSVLRGLRSILAARPWLLGLLLLSPSLRIGFLLDDHVFLGMLRGFIPVTSGWTGLYEFFFHGPEANQALIQDNFLPWWLDPRIDIRFFRPLSSILLRLDYECFGERPLFYHLHSLAWYVLGVSAAAMLYRRCFGGSLLTLGLLLFALDDSHALPGGWIANRNTYVAAVPAWFGLVAYLSFRERGFRHGLWLSLLGDAAGLLGGEVALSVLPYAFCYELFGARDPWSRRLAALLPKVLLFAGYFLVYRGLGKGASGSDFYVDPISQAGTFLAQLPLRYGALLCGTFVGVPSDLWLLAPRARPLLALAGLIAGAVVVGVLFRRRLASQDDPVRHLRWLCTGALASLLPCAATVPSNRLVASAMLAVAPCIVYLWSRAREQIRVGGRLRRTALRVSFLAFFGLHAVFAPLGLVSSLAAMLRMKRGSEQAFQQLKEHVPDGATTHVVVINAPDLVLSSGLPTMFALEAGRPLRSYSPLTMARVDLDVEVEGLRTLVISSYEPLLSAIFETLFRSLDTPFREGETVATDLFQATIRQVADGKVRRISFEFALPLSDPTLCLLYWDGRALERFPAATGGRFSVPFMLGPAGF